MQPEQQAADTPMPPTKRTPAFRAPTPEQVQTYCLERNNGISGQEFCDFYEAKGWFIGKNRMKDWQAAVRTWEKNRSAQGAAPVRASPGPWKSVAQRRQDANRAELQKFIDGEV